MQAKSGTSKTGKGKRPLRDKKKSLSKSPVPKKAPVKSTPVKKKKSLKTAAEITKAAQPKVRAKKSPVRMTRKKISTKTVKRAVVPRKPVQKNTKRKRMRLHSRPPVSRRRPQSKSIRTRNNPSPHISASFAPIAGPKYFFSTDIPGTYNETYMRALPRDPFWIFTYWEIMQGTLEDLKKRLGDKGFSHAGWILRISDITDIVYDGTNAWRSMDTAITPHANNWYVKVWEPGRTYLIQCGLLANNGAFTEAVRSNPIIMPRAGVSAVTDQEWSAAASDDLNGISTRYLKRSIGASEHMEESAIGAGPGPGIGNNSGSGVIF
jgi:hypothetical protein